MKNNILKKFLLLLSINLVIISHVWSTTYYVSVTGSNSNNGTSTSTPWRTLAYAANHVVSGDMVYVKAGNYGNDSIVLSIACPSGSPISFIGYKTNPGDAANLYISYQSSLDNDIIPTLDATLLPLLDGGNRTTGTGIKLHSSQYVVVKNFQVTNYREGLYAWGASHLTLNNILTLNTGDPAASYSGKGIIIGSSANYNTIKNCIVLNSCAEALSINGNNNSVTNSRVYCNENGTTEGPSTDYYLPVIGDNNTISGCYIERIGDLIHPGHGIGVKGSHQGNTFTNCTAVNIKGGGFYVRHRGAQNNTFTNCTSIGAVGFLVRDGASYNNFTNCTAKNCDSGIRFLDSSEDGGAQYAGRHNVFKNCIISNSGYAIDFNSWDQVSPADSNVFANCTFYDADYLFQTGRDNANNKMINCIVSNISNLKSGAKALNFAYTFCDFYNNGFTIREGGGNIALNPLFVNAAGGNFNLQTTSPCIDRGTSLACVTTDFAGTTRPQGCYYDMGAFEATTTCSKSLPSSNIENSNIDIYNIYPNPSEGIFTIEAKYLQGVEVYNINGQKIFTSSKMDKDKISVDLSNEPKGIYFVKILSNNKTITEKIVIM